MKDHAHPYTSVPVGDSSSPSLDSHATSPGSRTTDNGEILSPSVHRLTPRALINGLDPSVLGAPSFLQSTDWGNCSNNFDCAAEIKEKSAQSKLLEQLPQYVYWRKEGAITSIKNQGNSLCCLKLKTEKVSFIGSDSFAAGGWGMGNGVTSLRVRERLTLDDSSL
ncbi:hypothetical protein L1987_46499 [Smallanthus sonchifolius]|uniref:Uncharacterized protein n=1 Tax=Smallanthus sonchifolius TaxID=185202 RepID=A0ACB9G0Z4_9ASTR|nr:hypothetical protein L1987_46499 [Smallanthus sonchifolius]